MYFFASQWLAVDPMSMFLSIVQVVLVPIAAGVLLHKLLGERIPRPFSFVAHSDGDVAVHAVMDAILSALGEKDIGHLYPVDDPTYDGADSLKLLKGELKIMHEKGRSVASLSVCIIAEKPVIAPHIDRMRTRMAQALSLPSDKIGITATTNEKVGDIGHGEAVAACAYVLLK